MSIVWKIHGRLRNILPKRFIRFYSKIAEIYSDNFWSLKSYSSAGEDIVIRSLLLRREQMNGNTVLPEKGFYVDVGAFAPKQFSNTYFFYNIGWRGINIDAAPGSMKIFDRIRPRDTNVEAAVSDGEREMRFYTWGTPTVVNTLSAEHAAEFARRMNKEPEIVVTNTVTLASLLNRHLPKGCAIDFMNVDAEGCDMEVIRSNDWAKYRPFLVMVELAEQDCKNMLDSEIVVFLSAQGYKIASWIYPNIIFERK